MYIHAGKRINPNLKDDDFHVKLFQEKLKLRYGSVNLRSPSCVVIGFSILSLSLSLFLFHFHSNVLHFANLVVIVRNQLSSGYPLIGML